MNIWHVLLDILAVMTCFMCLILCLDFRKSYIDFSFQKVHLFLKQNKTLSIILFIKNSLVPYRSISTFYCYAKLIIEVFVLVIKGKNLSYNIFASRNSDHVIV